MAKRSREDGDRAIEETRPDKRKRSSSPDHLSSLSDELILRILSFLSVSQLLVCQRLSQKFQELATDGQLWKSHFYHRFVRPRASRLPGLRGTGLSRDSPALGPQASTWLEDEYLTRRGNATNWNRHYKLRHNWSKGNCAVNEIPVAQQPPVPPILVQMRDGVIYTADLQAGLRAWAAKGDRTLIAARTFGIDATDESNRIPPPTALAVDSKDSSGARKVLVGFEDGSFSVLCLPNTSSDFRHLYTHQPSQSAVLAAVAITWPYIMTMTATQTLHLYSFVDPAPTVGGKQPTKGPQLLHSLKSHTVWPPLSTTLRPSTLYVTMCIAFAVPTYLSGWTVGIQEIRIGRGGELLNSRIASAIDQHYRPLAFANQPIIHHLPANANGSLNGSPQAELRHIHSKPTSLSYTHPYLLVSHSDNTLTLYLVTSNAQSLSISPGNRLWGHTSSVSGAHVGGRGKAVSVSRRGDELLIWELEGGFTSSTSRKRLASGDLSVQVRPGAVTMSSDKHQLQSGLDPLHGTGAQSIREIARASDAELNDASELTLTRGWIGFDEENVVLLKEESQGKQALVVYDFT